MHSLPFWTCVACILAERSRFAPLPSSWNYAHDGRRCPLSHLLEPPRRRASAFAPAPALNPPTDCMYNFRRLLRAPDGRSGSFPQRIRKCMTTPDLGVHGLKCRS
eukprot:3329059-Pleurochrysis_carterae.AAC.1